jgi:hypothetical protein
MGRVPRHTHGPIAIPRLAFCVAAGSPSSGHPPHHPPPNSPRLVSAASLVSLHQQDIPQRTAPCLAAAVPPSTSRASATAPALATSPTNSNGTFPKASRPPRSSSSSPSPLPSISLCRSACPSLTMLLRWPPMSRRHVSLAAAPVACALPACAPRACCATIHCQAESNNLAAMAASSAAISPPRAPPRAGCKYPPRPPHAAAANRTASPLSSTRAVATQTTRTTRCTTSALVAMTS